MYKKTTCLVALKMWSGLVISILSSISSAEERLSIFVGTVSKLPTEDAVKFFEKETGVRVDAIYGGSGYILSQMLLFKQGDIYFPGSSDYMEKAKRERHVYPRDREACCLSCSSYQCPKGQS